MADRCRSCDAPITWAKTEKGRRIPLDPEPVEGGNVVLTVPIPRPAGQATPLARFVQADPGVMRHVSHFVSCPNASRHRKRDRKADRGAQPTP